MPAAAAAYYVVAAAVAVEAGTQIYAASQQRVIANKQADAALQAANYNANLDRAQAQQVAMDAAANAQRQRQADKTYLSAQKAAYAAAGINSDSGSPLAVQSTTAGRMEQDIQQYWTSTQQKESQLYSAAAEGIYSGQAMADTYHLQGTAALVSGIGKSVGTLGTAYGEMAGGG